LIEVSGTSPALPSEQRHRASPGPQCRWKPPWWKEPEWWAWWPECPEKPKRTADPNTYLRDKFHRLKVRMRTKKAAMAVAHKILLAIFHMLQRGIDFAYLGGDYLDRIDKHRTAKRLVRRLSALGYEVMLRPRAAQ
jgi:hypothetical protein